MQYTFDQLRGMTVAQLREVASGIQHEAVQGYTQMNKEHLLDALCKALNIDTHTRHKIHAAALDKMRAKSQMKELKSKRDAALSSHDHAQLKALRRQMHEIRRSLRRAATQKK
jgi:hypothetical protein